MDDIIMTATTSTELLTLKYVLKIMDKYPIEAVKNTLKDYIKELEAERETA